MTYFITFLPWWKQLKHSGWEVAYYLESWLWVGSSVDVTLHFRSLSCQPSQCLFSTSGQSTTNPTSGLFVSNGLGKLASNYGFFYLAFGALTIVVLSTLVTIFSSMVWAILELCGLPIYGLLWNLHQAWASVPGLKTWQFWGCNRLLSQENYHCIQQSTCSLSATVVPA